MENLSNLGLAGIILIKKDDLILNLFLDFINVNYTHIGFYYKNHTDNRYKTYLIDTIALPELTIKEYDLSNFIRSEAIVEIKYKKINKIGIGDHFKQCIREAFLAAGIIKTKKEIILAFFRKELLSFELFNKTLQKIDIRLTENAGNANRLYLLDSSYFAESNTLETKGPKAITCNTSLLGSINKMFIEAISKNPDLIVEIDQILKTNYLIASPKEPEVNLNNYLLSSQDVFKDILLGLKQRKFIGSSLIPHLQLMQTDLSEMNRGLPSTFIHSDSLSNNDILLVTDTKACMSAITGVKNLLTNICNDVKAGCNPVIKFNKLLDNFNNLLKIIDPNYRSIPLLNNEASMYALLSLNEPLGDIPVRLTHGDKILVPMNETNYSKFTKEQLEEMLVILDVYTTGNHKFDQVRSNIVKEITNKNV